MARDSAEPVEARSNAMLVLLIRRDPSVSEIFPELFEHPKLCHHAIRYCPLSDPKIVERLRALLDHPSDRIWTTAAVALSRNKDETIRRRLLEWLNHGDHGHRSVAIAGLVELDRDQAMEILQERWTEEQDADDRNVLAAALLRLGDTRGLSFLDAEARKSEGRLVSSRRCLYQRTRAGRRLSSHASYPRQRRPRGFKFPGLAWLEHVAFSPRVYCRRHPRNARLA